MHKVLGWIVFGGGCWMLISPQAQIGLNELRWMGRHAFGGEVLLAILVISMAYYLLDFKPVAIIRNSQKREEP